MQTAARHRVAIIGGGFGGLYAARRLGRDARIDLTLVDRRNHHVFQPLLYQVATGALAPGEIAQPLRSILRRNRNTTVLLGEAIGIDVERREVQLSDGGPIPYDTLVVATGARHSYFGHDEWARFAQGLKSIDDALEVRRRILIAFEAAEREHVPERRARVDDVPRRRRWPDRRRARRRPRRDRQRHAQARLPLDQPARRPDRPRRGDGPRPARLPARPIGVRAAPAGEARRDGPHRRRASPTSPSTRSSSSRPPAGTASTIPARTVLWAAGVQTSSFSRKVAAAAGAETDKAGRVKVGPDLTDPRPPRDLRDRRRGDPALEAGPARARRRPGRDPGRQVRRRRDPRAARWRARRSRSGSATAATSP